MSKHALEDFLAKLREDAGLRSELKERFGTAEEGIPLDQIAEFASAKGYQFSADEVEGELSDTDLEAVSGGVSALKGSLYLQKVFPKVELTGSFADGSVRLFCKW